MWGWSSAPSAAQADGKNHKKLPSAKSRNQEMKGPEGGRGKTGLGLVLPHVVLPSTTLHTLRV